MYVITAHLNGVFSWLLRRSDPPRARVNQSLYLLNPLVPVGRHSDDDSILSTGDEWYVVSQSLRFLSTNPRYLDSDSDGDYTLQVLPAFLTALRVESADPNQATMVKGEEVEMVEGRRLPPRRLEKLEPEHPVLAPRPGALRVAKRLRKTARFFARKCPPQHPVFAELALDAIQAQRTDPRKGILFAAFAVEQMARANLEGAYESARLNPDSNGAWRWVTRPAQRGLSVRKDPIFERLLKTSRFAHETLLVELPLYAFDRSMLDEHKELYDLVVRLRSTRNALTHEGEVDEKKTLPIDPSGAALAISAASAAFAWFGEVNYFYSLPQPSDPELDPDVLFGPDVAITKPPMGPISWRYTRQ